MFREIDTHSTRGEIDRSEIIEAGRISDAKVSLNGGSVVYSHIVVDDLYVEWWLDGAKQPSEKFVILGVHTHPIVVAPISIHIIDIWHEPHLLQV